MEPRSRDMAAVHCNTLVRWVREEGGGRGEGEVRAMDRCRGGNSLVPRLLSPCAQMHNHSMYDLWTCKTVCEFKGIYTAYK